jgi:hypothetical protein
MNVLFMHALGDLQAPIINWQVKASKAKAGFTKQRVLLIGQGSGLFKPSARHGFTYSTRII